MKNRRIEKTKRAIFHALQKLLEKKTYDDISVQEIIREADIGRSTFYSHFETKDELLHALCAELFAHVCAIDSSLIRETAAAPEESFRSRLIHTLSHLADPELRIKNILRSEGRGVFLKYFKKYMSEAFADDLNCSAIAAPEDYVRGQAAETLASTLQWWFASKKSYTAEEIADFYLSLWPDGLFLKEAPINAPA